MRGFFANSKGALTVFVTLLLIPAILASGTAVDLSRIYTARSIIEDANQLAANAVLSQYDALANELYGLFGVMGEDPQLAEMINEYVEISIFGGNRNEKGIGTFQLFYGSKFGESEILFEKDKNLKNSDVLRRQIEEYMKFRGPVVISREFLGALEKNTLGEDMEIIADKLAVDEFMREISDKYKELYNAVLEADKCKSKVGTGSFGSVSASLTAIKEQFIDLKSCYESRENAPEGSDEQKKYAEKCEGILEKIRQLTSGGSPRLNTWTDGKRNSAGAWVPGRWTIQNTTVVGLSGNITNAKNNAENFKEKFEAVAGIAAELDSMKSSLNAKIDSLENKLKNADGNPFGELFDRYREAANYDATPLAQKYKTAGNQYIEEVKNMIDGVKYRDRENDSAEGFSVSDLAGADMTAAQKAAYFADFLDVTYHLPPGFIKFSGLDDSGIETPGWEENGRFFKILQALLNGSAGKTINFDGSENIEKKDAEKKQRDITENFLKLIEEAYNSQKNEPEGAKYINAKKTPAADFDISEIFGLYNLAIEKGLTDVFSDPEKYLKSAADYILLLAYDTSMFSNYATGKPVGTAEKSIAGIPFGPDVNYFYQSEWEYIYNQSSDAGENLEAVKKLLFALRLVCNYISVFEISEIADMISSVQEAFSDLPLVGVELGEYARLAFAAAESVLDLAALRGGYRVPLIKKSGEWVFFPGMDLLDMAKNIDGGAYKSGTSYCTYMIYFFLGDGRFDGGDLLVERTAQLIEWNMINYKSKIGADEIKMAGEHKKAGGFCLDKLKTDFAITTAVDMKMLFLSAPFAQKGINGIIPPKTTRFAVTDYRGY